MPVAATTAWKSGSRGKEQREQRSCTPDPAPPKTPEEASLGSTPPQPLTSPSKQETIPPVHQLVGRMKTNANDMVNHILNVSARDAEDMLAVAEEAVRAIKTAKMEAKKRKPLGPSPGPAAAPTGETKQEAKVTDSPSSAHVDPVADAKPKAATTANAPRSYAAALRGVKTAPAPTPASNDKEKADVPRMETPKPAEPKAQKPQDAPKAEAPAPKTAPATVKVAKEQPTKVTPKKEPKPAQEKPEAQQPEPVKEPAAATPKKDKKVPSPVKPATPATPDKARATPKPEKDADKATVATKPDAKDKDAASKEKGTEKPKKKEEAKPKKEEPKVRKPEEPKVSAKERREEAKKAEEKALEAAQEQPPRTEEEIKTAARLNKCVSVIQRHAKLYVEEYQRNATRGHKDLNKSKLRGVLQRLKESAARPALHEMLTHCGGNDPDGAFSSLDNEFMRYNDGIGTLVIVAAESHKAKDLVVFRMACDILRRLLMDKENGEANVDFFLQSGGLVPFIQLMYDEIRILGRTSVSYWIAISLSITQIGLHRLLDPNFKMTQLRDNTIDMLTHAGVWEYIMRTLNQPPTVNELPSLLTGLCVVAQGLPLVTRRKPSSEKKDWLARVFNSLLQLLKVLLPTQAAELSPTSTAVIFVSMRILNTVCRNDILFVQSLVAPETGNYHADAFAVVRGVIRYIVDHEDQFESLPTFAAPTTTKGLSQNFKDAMKFGLSAALPTPPILTPATEIAENPKPVAASKEGTYVRAALHELLLFVGYISLENEKIQNFINAGETPLLQSLLGVVPVQYFMLCRHALFPTLIATAFNHEGNLNILKREMNVSAIGEFLQEEISVLRLRREKEIAAKRALTKAAEKAERERAKADVGGAGAGAGAGTTGSGARSVTGSSTTGVTKTMSWADMMDEDDEGIAFDDPFANASDAAPEWANRDMDDLDDDQPPATPTSVPVADEDILARELIRGLLKGPVPQGIPPSHLHYRLGRRFPMAMWPQAKEFFS